MAGVVSQQPRSVQRPSPTPLPPAADPLSEHAQLGRAIARSPQSPGSTVRVFQTALEAELTIVPGARSIGCDG